MSKCHKCKAPLVEGARFCPKCGVNLPIQQAVPGPTMDPVPAAAPIPAAAAVPPAQENPYQATSAVIDDRPLITPPGSGTGEYDRQFGASESIGEAFNIWSENLPRMVLMNLVPVIPVIIIVIIMVVMAIGAIGTAGAAWDNMDPSQWAGMFGALGVGTIVVFVILGLGMMLVTIPSMAGQFRIMDESEKNEAPTGLFAIYFWATRFILPLVGLFILVYLVMGATMIPAVIPLLGMEGASGGAVVGLVAFLLLYLPAIGFASLVVMARLVCTLPLMVVEGLSLFDALSRSNEMVKGQTWTVVATLMLFGLILVGISMVVGLLGMIPLIGQLVNLAFNLVFPPLQAALAFAIYAGLKTRQNTQDAAY